MICNHCREIQEERAAIHQFDGGCTRREADALAWKERCSKHQPKQFYQPTWKVEEIAVDGLLKERRVASFDSV